MIAIIAAMQEEIEYLLEKMTHKNKRVIASCHFYEGKLANQKVVLLRSGIGKVNAAMATTLLHEHYRPKYVINTGSAGGCSKDLNVGDVVLSTDVVHHDVDATSFDYAYGQVPGMPKKYKADLFLLGAVKKQLKDLNLPYKAGTIATGDSFMDDQAQVHLAKKRFPSLIAFEMEAAAVAQICYIYQSPFVILRALSDIAGKQSSLTFEQFLEKAVENSSKIVIETVHHLGIQHQNN